MPMIQIFQFLLKEYSVFMIMTLIAMFFGMHMGSFWNFIPYIFLIFFLYEWNIQSKNNRTWYFFESSPLTFFHRYFIHFIFPFCFSFFIFFMLKFSAPQEHEILKPIYDSMRFSSIFVLSSLMARGIPSYFLQLIFLSLISYTISHYHFFEISLFVFSAFSSAYFISGRRFSPRKFIQLPLLGCAMILFYGYYLLVPTYSLLLKVPIHTSQNLIVKTMIQDNLIYENSASLRRGHQNHSMTSLIFYCRQKINQNYLKKIKLD